MAGRRKLSAQEVAAIGLEVPAPKRRALSPDEARALGLEVVQPAPETAPRRPSALQRTLTLGSVLPIAGAASGLAGLYDFATGQRSGSGETLDDMHRGVLQGYTMGFGDELTGAIGSAAGEDYDTIRNRERAENHAARNRSGYAYGTGEMVGGAALPLPGGTATNAGRVALARALGQGALGGVGLSEGTTGRDMAGDAAIGAGSGLATYLGGRFAAGPLAVRASPVLRRTLDKLAVGQGRRALLNGADSLSGRAPIREDAIREAIDSGAIIPGGTTAGNYARLDNAAEQVGARYGGIVEELERQGVRGPVAADVAARLNQKAAELRPRVMNPAEPALFEEQAAELMTKPRFQAVPTGQPAATGGQRMAIRRDPQLGLSQAEDLKRSLQKQARYDRVRADPMNEAREEVASIVRQANEEAVEAAGRANPGTDIEHLADGFVPVKRRLGNLLEARGAAERGAAGVSRRGFFGLPEHLQMANSSDSGVGLVKALVSKVLRERGPSTIAFAARHASGPGLDQAMRASPQFLARSAGPVTTAEQEALIQWLRQKREPGATE